MYLLDLREASYAGGVFLTPTTSPSARMAALRLRQQTAQPARRVTFSAAQQLTEENDRGTTDTSAKKECDKMPERKTGDGGKEMTEGWRFTKLWWREGKGEEGPLLSFKALLVFAVITHSAVDSAHCLPSSGLTAPP